MIKKMMLSTVTIAALSSIMIIGCGGGSDNGYTPPNNGGGDGGHTHGFPVITLTNQSIALRVRDQNKDLKAIVSNKEDDNLTDPTEVDPLLDLPVSAWDEEDGDLTDQIVTVSTVDTTTEGNYTVTYTVTDSDGQTTVATRDVAVVAQDPGTIPIDTSTQISGSALACDYVDGSSSTDANEMNASVPFKTAVSSPMLDIPSRKLLTSHNTMARLGMVMAETNATGGQMSETKYHPLVMNYLEQISGDYLLGDGSADIGDPNNVDRVMVALSRDNGKTWKKQFVSYSTTVPRSSIEVEWGNGIIEYPGDAQKPDMAISGNNILVAWNDKYCPSGNPLDLPKVLDENNKTTYPTDIFAVNGPQGFIDYRLEDVSNGNDDNVTDENVTTEPLDGVEAPNGKLVYQVPFSCVWTARGIVDPQTAEITWHAPKQLTTGTRDSNHVWIAGSAAGFAIAWQEDVKGLKSGKGAGPGEGWSGATTNRGSDIWYTSIKMQDFAASSASDNDGKPVSANNFHYPVRITDNEQCQAGDKKLYCDYFCNTFGEVNATQGNESADIITRCLTHDTDMLTNTIPVLDGDTGASRSAIKILKTNTGDHVVVLGYEETKALSVKIIGEGDIDQGTIPTDIEVEGKSVYFESFNFNAIDAFDESNIATIQNTAMPIVSAGNIINPRYPDEDNASKLIYENARRLVIGTQVDSCDAQTAGDLTFAIMYKQSFETRGASSDMFIRTWRGFNYDDIAPLNGLYVTNVSAQNEASPGDPADYVVDWSPSNLGDPTYANKRENTFSPRIFLRGANVYTGFEYTPYETLPGETDNDLVGKYPNNFHTHIYRNGAWQKPQNITKVLVGSKNTVDARFFTTPKGSYDSTGVESDKSNPDVLFVTWGTTLDSNSTVYFETNVTGEIDPGLEQEILEGDDRITAEADLFFVRSTDNGVSWEEEQNLSSVAHIVIEEKEVGSFASPDGKHIYNSWLQQSVILPQEDVAVTGLDSWFGRVDYNVSNVDQ